MWLWGGLFTIAGLLIAAGIVRNSPRWTWGALVFSGLLFTFYTGTLAYAASFDRAASWGGAATCLPIVLAHVVEIATPEAHPRLR